jgi:VanZ family protein
MTFRGASVWLLPLGWAAVMFWMSTERFGVSESRPVFARLLDFVHISLSPATFRTVHTVLRKLAHVVEYAALVFLLYRAFEGPDRLVWRARSAQWCLAVGTLFSFTDEFHQIFVNGRGASLFDCAIDIVGLSVGLLLVYIAARGFGRQHFPTLAPGG